jgi:hypothetical protein
MKTLLYILLLFPALAFANMPAFPMAFWGTVTLDGQPAPSGTIVRAYYGSALAGEAVVNEPGIYGYTEPTKQKLVAGEGTGEITFTVQSSAFNGGKETQGTSPMTQSGFISGETIQKALVFTGSVQSSSSGGSHGGSSGGSSSGSNKSGSSKSTPSGAVLGASTSTSSSSPENVIELQRQVISLLTILASLLQQLIAIQAAGN